MARARAAGERAVGAPSLIVAARAAAIGPIVVARAAAVGLIVAALAAVSAAPATAGWSRPVRFADPVTLDVLPPALGFSPTGAAAVVFGVQDSNAPANSAGYAIWRTPGGRISAPRRVPGSQDVLDVAFDGQTAELLVGASPPGMQCCSSASVVQLTGVGAFRRQQTLSRQLASQAVGALVPLGDRMLAAFATARGVWVSQSARHGRFGTVHRLTPPGAVPEALQAVRLAHGGAIIAWSESRGATRASGPNRIYVASGSQKQAPSGPRAAVTLSEGRVVDELGVTSSSGAVTLAWVEHRYDRRGNDVSDVAAMDLTRHPVVRRFAVRGTIASGLSFAGNAAGDQVLAWKTCGFNGSCAVRASVRRTTGRFGAPVRVDAIDASEAPVVASSPTGSGALLGWIRGGHVLAASLGKGAGRFSAPRVVSGTPYAANLALGYAPSGRTALAAWSQATLAPEVVGAVYSG